MDYFISLIRKYLGGPSISYGVASKDPFIPPCSPCRIFEYQRHKSRSAWSQLSSQVSRSPVDESDEMARISHLGFIGGAAPPKKTGGLGDGLRGANHGGFMENPKGSYKSDTTRANCL